MLRAFAARGQTVWAPRLYRTATPRYPTRLFATESKQEGSAESGSSSDASTSPDAANGEPAQAAEPLTIEEQLTKQLEEKELELASLNDRTLRVLAEMENVRMIARRDVDNAKQYSVMPFANGLLSVADNLGLALKAVPQEALDNPDNQQLKGLFTGVGATEAELLKVFSQHGISRFGDVGDRFDPNKYQAVFEAPSPDHEPGTVIDVTKLGYAIGDRILRPAEVGVAKAP